jgi:serine/threonine-protein kinase
MSREDNIETILQPGALVGAQYRVDRLIAKGGMAAVWAGVNEHTGKRVALKVILHSFASNRDAVELFRREALAASKINHPNVVNIFDVIDHDGMTCIVMELFDGETLGSYLERNGSLTLENTLALLLPAMRGVAAANAQGVVHRDLKPENIFLCSSPEGQLITTKVLDFGISVMMRRAGETAPKTEHLAMFGTPAYMAPEAIEFSPNIDGRADVYGFGVLLFEMLTGKLPFLGPPGLDLLERILSEPAPLVTLYRPDLPLEVVNLVASALAKAPQDRFPDMDHLIHAVEDRLLPLLPEPRPLTPMSGIYVLPPTESDAETFVPIVQPKLEKASLDRPHMNETRVLYSMASEPLHATNGTGSAGRRKLSPVIAVKPTRRKHVPLASSRHFTSKRVAFGTALCAFLIVTAWVYPPAVSSERGRRPEQSPRRPYVAIPWQQPVVTLLPTTPAPVPAPAIAVEIVEAPTIPPRPEIRVSAPHSFHHASRAKSPTVVSRAKPPTEVSRAKPPPNGPPMVQVPSVHRAGTLSESDF